MVVFCQVQGQGQTNDHGPFNFKKANLLFKFDDTMTSNDILNRPLLQILDW